MRASLHETVAASLRELPVPVFFAGVNTGMSQLTVHVHAGCDIGALKSQVETALQTSGVPLDVTVRAHRLRQLSSPRSLEQLLATFKLGQLVLHDPTRIISHARRLLAAAKSCRTVLGKAITGTFFDPDRRTLFVLAPKNAAALQPRVATLVACACGGASLGSADLTSASRIRAEVVERLPHRRLVPVDARSASTLRRMTSVLRRWLAPAAIALAMSAAAPAGASTGPIGLEKKGASIEAPSPFGVLSGLSILSEVSRYDAFAALTLGWFFGETGHAKTTEPAQGLQLAQAQKKIDNCVDVKGTPTGADCGPPFPAGS